MTDRLDAMRLARLLRAGELTPVWVPDETHGIHPVKAAATSDLTVAVHGDHLEKVFHTERSEGQHLDLGDAVDPDYAVFRLHADGEIMKPIDGFAQLGARAPPFPVRQSDSDRPVNMGFW